ncbi:hypothetical protein F4677DRAFT_48637 [Hypoxylon crocopeplum]|nr:hypothetical protein F4677DRAFT_48637 [Hypoxylon crocopeplum]
MDPATAIGLASSIIAFVEFSYKLVVSINQIANDGSTTQNGNVEVVVDDLVKVTNGLDQELIGTSAHEIALRELASKCKTLSGELQSLLKGLRPQKDSKWENIAAALRSMHKKGEITEKLSVLAEYRSEISVRLLSLLNERQTTILVEVNSLGGRIEENHSNIFGLLTTLQNEVRGVIDSQAQAQNTSDLTEEERSPLQKIQEVLNTLLKPSQKSSPEMRVLRQLYFQSMYSREDSVRDAESDTFKWILDDDDWYRVDEDNQWGTWWKEKIDNMRSLRLQTRTTFIEWLSAGNQIFHMSGKPGSGKSTLMKLLANHRRTQEELKIWSGDKRLVFAQFFAWSSGDDMQKSLHGLLRSILFAVLKQCTDLIPQVFPDAYHTFSTTQYEPHIDEPFFRFPFLIVALRKLVKSLTNRGYRFCFIIDGLAEFKDDIAHDLSHEDLAGILTSWAENDDVKLLVSSRPYGEFMSAFSDELRIKLHELTMLDIMRFGREMFEKHKSFHCVKDCYVVLTETVAMNSAGVFLWARLAIRKLLRAIPAIQDAKKLKKLLDATPQDINALYESLLQSIDSAYQERVFKMLWLVGKTGRCKVVSFTWVDELLTPDSDFPIKHQIGTYSDTEMERRIQEAELLVLQTKGLLEITTENSLEAPGEYIHFFHRTVADFVNQSEHIRIFSARYPELSRKKLKIKMNLAEMWFLEPTKTSNYIFDLHDELMDRPNSGEGWEKNDEERHAWLDAVEMVVQFHDGNGANYGRAVTNNPGGTDFRYSGERHSHLHWLAGHVNDWKYIWRKIRDRPDVVRANGQLSLLLSAAVSHNRSPNLSHFFEIGASPNDLVKLYRWEDDSDDGSEDYASIWMIFCAFFAFFEIEFRWLLDLRTIYRDRLVDFLNTGEVDPNVFFVLGLRGEYEDLADDGGTHIISLEDMTKQIEPDDIELWDRLFSRSTGNAFRKLRRTWNSLAVQGIHGILHSLWTYATKQWTLAGLVTAWSDMVTPKPKPDQLLLQNKYLPFRVRMDPGIPPKGYSEKEKGEYGFHIHSVIIGDVKILASKIRVRIW